MSAPRLLGIGLRVRPIRNSLFYEDLAMCCRFPVRRFAYHTMPILLTLLVTLPGTAADQHGTPVGFRALFNGKNLDGWHGNNPHQTAKVSLQERQAAVTAQQGEFEAHWRVDGGELVNDGHGPYATTNEELGDIELLLDYKTVPKADSGIYLRGTPQVQIWDTTEAGGKWERGADKGSGGLVALSQTGG